MSNDGNTNKEPPPAMGSLLEYFGQCMATHSSLILVSAIGIFSILAIVPENPLSDWPGRYFAITYWVLVLFGCYEIIRLKHYQNRAQILDSKLFEKGKIKQFLEKESVIERYSRISVLAEKLNFFLKSPGCFFFYFIFSSLPFLAVFLPGFFPFDLITCIVLFIVGCWYNIRAYLKNRGGVKYR